MYVCVCVSEGERRFYVELEFDMEMTKGSVGRERPCYRIIFEKRAELTEVGLLGTKSYC